MIDDFRFAARRYKEMEPMHQKHAENYDVGDVVQARSRGDGRYYEVPASADDGAAELSDPPACRA